MSFFRSKIELAYDLLKTQAGESIDVTRSGETIRIYAIVEEPTRALEGTDGFQVDTERQPFVIQCDDYRFDGVPTEPLTTDRIVWNDEVWQPWGEGTTPHVERSDPFGKAWRVFTIRDEANDC